MTRKLILRVEAPHFTAGAVFEKQGCCHLACISAPPIMRWMMGKHWQEIKLSLRQRKYRYDFIEGGTPACFQTTFYQSAPGIRGASNRDRRHSVNASGGFHHGAEAVEGQPQSPDGDAQCLSHSDDRPLGALPVKGETSPASTNHRLSSEGTSPVDHPKQG